MSDSTSHEKAGLNSCSRTARPNPALISASHLWIHNQQAAKTAYNEREASGHGYNVAPLTTFISEPQRSRNNDKIQQTTRMKSMAKCDQIADCPRSQKVPYHDSSIASRPKPIYPLCPWCPGSGPRSSGGPRTPQQLKKKDKKNSF